VVLFLCYDNINDFGIIEIRGGNIMCGRFIVSYNYNDLLKFMENTFNIFDLDQSVDVPNYNVAPGTDVLSIISDGEKYRAGTFKWGFIPSFAKDINNTYKMINSRVEGIESKNAFKDSFMKRRCLILADGYYEWKINGKGKIPYLIQKSHKEMFFLAGIWSKSVKENGEVIYSTSIITKAANNSLLDIHPRMPIILNEDNAKRWINPSQKDKVKLLLILNNDYNDNIVKMRVSEYVNKVSNNSKKCIEEFTDNRLF